MDCGICYFTFPIQDFFQLECCKNNNVCRQCIELLTNPLCPYCRAHIPSLSGKRLAVSYQDTTISSPRVYQPFQLDPMDDIYTDSRILRRQMKRLRKLQERERDALRNRQLSEIYKENKQHYRREMTRQISEDKSSYDEEQDQFSMDD